MNLDLNGHSFKFFIERAIVENISIINNSKVYYQYAVELYFDVQGGELSCW